MESAQRNWILETAVPHEQLFLTNGGQESSWASVGRQYAKNSHRELVTHGESGRKGVWVDAHTLHLRPQFAQLLFVAQGFGPAGGPPQTLLVRSTSRRRLSGSSSMRLSVLLPIVYLRM